MKIWKNEIKNIDFKKLKYKNTGITYELILKKEIYRFFNILQGCIDAYYRGYSPIIYKRTYNMHNSINVNDICEISASNMTIIAKILIDENAIHNSMFGSGQGNSFWLVNDGWKVKKNVWFKNIERFGYFKGAHFVEDAVAQYKNSNKYGINIRVIRPLIYYS